MDATTATKTLSFRLPGGSKAAGAARRSVLSVRAGLPGAIRHRVALLLSELVTNAVQHGGADPHEDVQVRLASTADRVRVEVFDPGPTHAPPRHRVDEGGGYGLLLVDRLADDWGREETRSGGCLAWFEVSLDHLGDY